MSGVRPPRPLLVHWAVDAAVVFLAVVVLGLFFDLSIWAIAVAAVLVGAVAAPCTRRAEIRGLAARADEEADGAQEDDTAEGKGDSGSRSPDEPS